MSVSAYVSMIPYVCVHAQVLVNVYYVSSLLLCHGSCEGSCQLIRVLSCVCHVGGHECMEVTLQAKEVDAISPASFFHWTTATASSKIHSYHLRFLTKAIDAVTSAHVCEASLATIRLSISSMKVLAVAKFLISREVTQDASRIFTGKSRKFQALGRQAPANIG